MAGTSGGMNASGEGAEEGGGGGRSAHDCTQDDNRFEDSSVNEGSEKNIAMLSSSSAGEHKTTQTTTKSQTEKQKPESKRTIFINKFIDLILFVHVSCDGFQRCRSA